MSKTVQGTSTTKCGQLGGMQGRMGADLGDLVFQQETPRPSPGCQRLWRRKCPAGGQARGGASGGGDKGGSPYAKGQSSHSYAMSSHQQRNDEDNGARGGRVPEWCHTVRWHTQEQPTGVATQEFGTNSAGEWPEDPGALRGQGL